MFMNKIWKATNHNNIKKFYLLEVSPVNKKKKRVDNVST